ncbi:MAG: response regulator [Phycisphaerales bacterium]|nr:response regulator [Phycisphaerales bacterium]
MVETQPKLVIVGGHRDMAQELKDQLGDRYEIVEQPDDSGLAAVLKALGEGVCIVDPDGEISWSNDYFKGLDVETQREVLSLCIQSADSVASLKHETRGALVTKHEVSTLDGQRIFDIYITGIAQRDDDGMHAGRVAAIVRDVTMAKHAERKMIALDRAGFELVRLDVQEIREMNAMERLQLLEKRIVRFSNELLNFDHFGIFLIDQKTNRLQMVMQSGFPQEIQDLDLYLESEGSGISGHVASTGKSYICNDATQDERFLPGLSGARSSLTVPLRVSDRIIGIMDIESKQPGEFDEQDQMYAEIFGRYVAMALHMLQLLVSERTETNLIVSDRVTGEINEPLDDIIHEIDWLTEHEIDADDETKAHIKRIMMDVESIRNRVKSVASGPQTLLGVDKALLEREKDPKLIGKRVLVVDDNQKIRKIIGEVLTHRGCETTVVSDGSQAIQLLEEISENNGQAFDLVISDIQMPDRNGYEVFSAARKNCPGVPVILMTGFGYDPHHSIVRASQDGLQSVLFKPFEIELLMGQVREALGIVND